MKVELSELKKWVDIKVEFSNYLNDCLEYWKNEDFKNSIQWQTLYNNNFIKDGVIDLKNIEMVDDSLMSVALEILLKSYIMKEYNNDGFYDIKKLISMSEDEIRNSYKDEEEVDNEMYKKSIQFKSLKKFGIIDSQDMINDKILSEYPISKKFFISLSLHIIKSNGLDYHPELVNSLLKMKILS